jgi:hypothetical protein
MFAVVLFVFLLCSISLMVSLAAKRRPARVNVRAPPHARNAMPDERV